MQIQKTFDFILFELELQLFLDHIYKIHKISEEAYLTALD